MKDLRRYKANFTQGGLMVAESRVVADILLQGADAGAWRQAIAKDNALRKRSPKTAATKANLIRARLRTMSADLWRLVRDGSRPVATHAVFAVTIKYSPLVGDFLDLVVRDLYRRFEESVKPQHWARFLEACRNRDPAMPDWSPGTEKSLRTRVLGMMAEAGYLADARTRRLRPVQLSPEVLQYLRASGEDYALRCMDLTP